MTRPCAPAGQFTTYAYSGNTVTVTDAAGKWKTYTLDSAGNIAKVTEPNPAGGTWDTLYSYNGLNQLTRVRMTRGAVTQDRIWVYNSNQKLVSETLPETLPASATRTFGYDSAGRLSWKKDAKNQKIAFEYDNYDRVTAVKRYPVDGGAEDTWQRVTLAYDGTTGNSKGRLKEAQYGTGWTEAYAYTNAGLPLTKSLTWPSTGAGVLTLTAEYDNEGRRTSLRYPTHYTKPGSTYVANLGRKLMYGFDAAGRLGSVNQETGGYLISAINYNAASQVTSWTRAWDTNPSASETFTFNTAGQLTRQNLVSSSTLVDVEYRYSATNNDGRLWQRKNWVSGEEVTYQYDALARLSAAATTSTAWGLSWTYDGFGNRLQQSVTKGAAPVHSVAVDGQTNRMVGQSYDLNGNMLIPGLVYDWDNRLAGDGATAYMYSTSNQRLKAYDVATGINYAWFHGFEGEMLAVYKLEPENGDQNRTWPVLQTAKERVYAMGRLIRMGTQDVVMDRGASVIRHGTQNLAYYPYGEEQGGASANDRAKYATYTRDASTGLDYAVNRMYKVEWGRFTTADPSAAQSTGGSASGWNRNAYVEGDPVNYYDPKGLNRRVLGFGWDCGSNWVWDASLSGPCIDDDGGGGGGGGGAFGYILIETIPKDRLERGATLDLLRRGALAIASAALLANRVATADPGTMDSVRVPTYLKVVDQCWRPDSASTKTYTRVVTYQVLDNTGAPMNGPKLNGITVSESFSNFTKGFELMKRSWATWSTSDGTIRPEGTIQDWLSAGGGIAWDPPQNGGAFQTFTATGSLNGSPLAAAMPLHVTGFGPTTAVLDNWFSPTDVTINGTSIGTDPAKKCPF